MRHHRLSAYMAVAFALLLSESARADAIDGDWCHQDGRRFSIRGAEIVTPAGSRLSGNYSRHYYSYTVPAPEKGAGQTIFMTLYSENIVHLRVGDQSAAATEIWNRCAASVS